MRQHIVRTHLLGFIWLVTAIDLWCCQFIQCGDGELNPIAKFIILEWGVWTLVGLKTFGTWIATEWLRHLPIWYSFVVAGGMLVLLLFLGGII